MHRDEHAGPIAGHGGANRIVGWSMGGSILAATLSSACCWLPLALLAAGLSAGGMAGAFEAVRPFLLIAAALSLGAAFYFAYFREPACGSAGACAPPNAKLQRLHRGMLWAATAFVIAFALFPYYSGALLAGGSGGASPVEPTAVGMEAGPREMVFTVEGMSCAGCAGVLRSRLAGVPGVESAEVDYSTGRAVVKGGQGEMSVDALLDAARETGFPIRWAIED